MVLEDALPEEYFSENFAENRKVPGAERRDNFIEEFDREIGDHTSKLVDYKVNSEKVVAESVREIFGKSQSELSDGEAIELAINPARNKVLGNSLVLTTHDKISRALYHASYTFKKKLSHTADSQDQRHRMTPGSRPLLTDHFANRAGLHYSAIGTIGSWSRKTLPRDHGLNVGFDKQTSVDKCQQRICRLSSSERIPNPVHRISGSFKSSS